MWHLETIGPRHGAKRQLRQRRKVFVLLSIPQYRVSRSASVPLCRVRGWQWCAGRPRVACERESRIAKLVRGVSKVKLPAAHLSATSGVLGCLLRGIHLLSDSGRHCCRKNPQTCGAVSDVAARLGRKHRMGLSAKRDSAECWLNADC